MNGEKISRREYYVARPLRRAARKLSEAIRRKCRNALGVWWCDGCNEYHNGRVVQYMICPELDGVCRKHWKREYFGKNNAVYIGSENVTAEYLPQLKKSFGITGKDDVCRVCGQPFGKERIKCREGYVCKFCCDMCADDEPFPCKHRDEYLKSQEGK